MLFPAPGRADDGNGVPGLGHQGQAFDERLVEYVPKRHVLDCDTAFPGRGRGDGLWVGCLFGCVQQLEDAFGLNGGRG